MEWTPQKVIEKIFSEVGSENRELVWDTLDEVRNTTRYWHGPVEEALDYTIKKVKEKLPKQPPAPEVSDFTPGKTSLDHGAIYRDTPEDQKNKDGFIGAMRARRLRKWGEYGNRS